MLFSFLFYKFFILGKRGSFVLVLNRKSIMLLWVFLIFKFISLTALYVCCNFEFFFGYNVVAAAYITPLVLQSQSTTVTAAVGKAKLSLLRINVPLNDSKRIICGLTSNKELTVTPKTHFGFINNLGCIFKSLDFKSSHYKKEVWSFYVLIKFLENFK